MAQDHPDSVDEIENFAPTGGGSLKMTPAQQARFDQGRGQARIIAHLITRKVPASIEFDDLHQAALIGLVRASQKYVAEGAAATFESFARHFMHGAAMDYLREASPLTRGNTAFQKLLEKATQHLLTQSLDKVSDADLATHMGISWERFSLRKGKLEANWLFAWAQQASPGEHSAENEGLVAEPDIPDESTNPAALLDRRQRIQAFMKFQEKLSVRERMLLDLVQEGRQLKEIGALFNITISRVTQLLGNIQTRLEQAMASKFGDQASGAPRAPDFHGGSWVPGEGTKNALATLASEADLNDPNPLGVKLASFRKAREPIAVDISMLDIPHAPIQSVHVDVEEKDGQIVIRSNTRWG